MAAYYGETKIVYVSYLCLHYNVLHEQALLQLIVRML